MTFRLHRLSLHQEVRFFWEEVPGQYISIITFLITGSWKTHFRQEGGAGEEWNGLCRDGHAGFCLSRCGRP
jgi:hypothetical protein